jgi:hypothetical protein
VHEEPARILPLAVPAPEVIGAVLLVEEPGEVDQERATHHPVFHQAAKRRVRRRVAIVEGDPERAPRARDHVEDGPHLLRVRRHRLLGDHVAAELHRPHDVLVVRRVHRRDYDRVGGGVGDHAVEALGWIRGPRRTAVLGHEPPVVPVHPGPAQVAEGHQLGRLPVSPADPVDVEARARAGPDDRVATTTAHPANDLLTKRRFIRKVSMLRRRY